MRVLAMRVLLATVALNIGSHVAMTVVLGGCAPGLITSVGVMLPVTTYGLTRAIGERWAPAAALALLPVVALLLHGPVLILLLTLAGRRAAAVPC